MTSERQFSQMPESGDSLRLTIDDELQRTAEEALAYGVRLAHDNGEWAANGGALVAMDVNTGEILALASNPTFDPSLYVGTVDEKDLKALANKSANFPTLNRAIDGTYPPGSTFKPITALAALEEDLLSAGEVIQCTGKMVVDKQTFMNWDPYRNEPMVLSTALANSCDTYFYDVGLRFYRLEGSPLQRWSRQMGFGKPTGVDLGPESEGVVPTPEWEKRTEKTEIDKLWTSGESVQLAIGQGDLLVTPLQMTRAYAMIANGGKLVEPHLVKAVEEPRNEGEPAVVLRPFTPKPPVDLNIDPYNLSVVQEGLFDATHASYGTSQSVFGAFPIPIAGKTGTAEKVVDAAGLPGPARPVLVVRLRALREARDRRLRPDRERRPRRRGGRSRGAEGLRGLLQRRARAATRRRSRSPTDGHPRQPDRAADPRAGGRLGARRVPAPRRLPAAPRGRRRSSPTGSGCSSR